MKYSHNNWNQVLNLPEGPDKVGQLKTVGWLAKGNLQWFVRRLIGGNATDRENGWIDQKIQALEALPKSTFLEFMSHYEDIIGQDQ